MLSKNPIGIQDDKNWTFFVKNIIHSVGHTGAWTQSVMNTKWKKLSGLRHDKNVGQEIRLVSFHCYEDFFITVEDTLYIICTFWYYSVVWNLKFTKCKNQRKMFWGV